MKLREWVKLTFSSKETVINILSREHVNIWPQENFTQFNYLCKWLSEALNVLSFEDKMLLFLRKRITRVSEGIGCGRGSRSGSLYLPLFANLPIPWMRGRGRSRQENKKYKRNKQRFKKNNNIDLKILWVTYFWDTPHSNNDNLNENSNNVW